MSEINLMCLSGSYHDELKSGLDELDVVEVYGAGPRQLDQGRLMKTPVVLRGPAPDLLQEDRTTSPKDDAVNAMQVHRYLGLMTSLQGADQRVWAYLTHAVFHEYTKARWGVEGGKDPAKHVRNRWFMRGGRQGLLGNSIARLWWGAHMTYAPWESDPYFEPLSHEHEDDYVYTRMLFRNQNLYQGLVARRFGSSARVRIGLLEALYRQANDHANLSALSEEVERRVNLVCSYRVLSALPLETLLKVLGDHVDHARTALETKPAAGTVAS